MRRRRKRNRMMRRRRWKEEGRGQKYGGCNGGGCFSVLNKRQGNYI